MWNVIEYQPIKGLLAGKRNEDKYERGFGLRGCPFERPGGVLLMELEVRDDKWDVI